MPALPPRAMPDDLARLYVLEATIEILKTENEILKRRLAAAEAWAAQAAITERLDRGGAGGRARQAVVAAAGERLAMPIEDWQRVARFLYDWQALAAGLFVLLAAVGTIWATRSTASRQIKAACKEADRVIAATRAQTEATFKQTEATVRLEDLRNASESEAFYVMLEAAMARVLAEAARARRTYLPILTQTAGLSLDGLVVRRCITKGAFAELRAACVRRGGDLTGEFLDLEREIDSFASQYEDRPTVTQGVTLRMGKLAGLDEQLASIERKADALREKAFERAPARPASRGATFGANYQGLPTSPNIDDRRQDPTDYAYCCGVRLGQASTDFPKKFERQVENAIRL